MAKEKITKIHMPKAVIIKAHSTYKVGDRLENLTSQEFATLADAGIAVSASEYDANQRVKTTNLSRINDAIKAAQTRGALPIKDDADAVIQCRNRAEKWLETAPDADVIVEWIGQLTTPVQAADREALTQRLTRAGGDDGGRIELIRADIRDSGKGYVEAREPMDKLIRAGRVKEATDLSIKAAAIYTQEFAPIMARGHDLRLGDALPVKAAGMDVLDPDSQLGTLGSGMVIQRNLGFLKKKLNFMSRLTTDMRNEPVPFATTVRTRYITPPNVLTYIPGVGYTSDATTISNASATTTQAGIATQTSGTRTLSVPATTDVDVKIDQHKAVEIFFPNDKLGSTMRNLFAEQYSAQLYSLAETINTKLLSVLFGATWTGIVTALSLGDFGLPTMVTLKNRMTLSKIPDIGRFALFHSFYHDALLTDTNLLSAKAILALINKDASAFDSGDVPELFGVKPLESQLCSFKDGVQTDPNITAATGEVDFAGPGINQIGFAGNMSSALFVARVPQDYTTVLKDIPATAALQIVTEPDSGLSVLVAKFVDHGKAEVHQRVALMYGFAQGDPRQGIILKP